MRGARCHAELLQWATHCIFGQELTLPFTAQSGVDNRTDLADEFDPSSLDRLKVLGPIVWCLGKRKPDCSWLARYCGFQALGRQRKVDQADANLAVLVVDILDECACALQLAAQDDDRCIQGL